MSDYYVISVHHTLRRDLYITVWAPDDKGYRLALSRAGRYEEGRVRAHLGYYNTGANVAVPCSVLDAIAVPPIPGHHDNDAGPCVPNTRASWKVILSNVIEPPKHKPEPMFKGARLTKEEKEYA